MPKTLAPWMKQQLPTEVMVALGMLENDYEHSPGNRTYNKNVSFSDGENDLQIHVRIDLIDPQGNDPVPDIPEKYLVE